jgi:hypothetical protein
MVLGPLVAEEELAAASGLPVRPNHVAGLLNFTYKGKPAARFPYDHAPEDYGPAADGVSAPTAESFCSSTYAALVSSFSESLIYAEDAITPGPLSPSRGPVNEVGLEPLPRIVVDPDAGITVADVDADVCGGQPLISSDVTLDLSSFLHRHTGCRPGGGAGEGLHTNPLYSSRQSSTAAMLDGQDQPWDAAGATAS